MNERGSLYRSSDLPSPVGSGIRPRFVKDISESPYKLKQVGTTDQQALIQSFADECDVNRIVARYEAGDLGVLSRVQGLYGDVTGYPDNPVSALNLAVQARSLWDNLPPEEQAKFGTQEAYINALVNSLDNPVSDNPVSPPAGDSAPSGGNSNEGGTAE